MAKQPSPANRNGGPVSNVPSVEEALLVLQMIQQASFPSVQNKRDAAALQTKMERIAEPALRQMRAEAA